MSGALVWAVKASFVEYVDALGTVDVVAPAPPAADRSLRLPPDRAAGGYRGSVAFRAHHGAMDIVLRDPRLEAAGLSVEYDDHGRRRGRIVIAGVDGERTVLETDGAIVFDFTYPVGSELAPVRIES